MTDFYRIYAVCPYYSKNDYNKIVCENGCIIKFYKMTEVEKYLGTYCTQMEKYHECSIAKAFNEHYEGAQNAKKN